ncbi:hypothetical protein CO054_02035 [Candidatus Shapirobacteria bacterium CG_4_9_14_0_2_um_filter_39_11]|uniref:Phosphoribosyltransferase domain-containing protein n=1 Tax=Candidatus Shapirobacteria bacterium CG_4_9_14_0_2_um_filter_39_11 TaxID=1974478 RepID=A0A2M8ESI8_9BACT|nr:MAG: hypothetical protein CO054_02035 [Candidatus Shapirobacteria bacterium CG_4_9_14_0_2_um_filter_39_11]
MERVEIRTKSQEIEIQLQALKEKFEREAKIKNKEISFISCPWVNQKIEQVWQDIAAKSIVSKFIPKLPNKITKIAGIPELGRELASAVAHYLPEALLIPTRKMAAGIPGTWDNILLVEDVPSFTTTRRSTLAFPFVEKGDVFLLVDDFCAYGNTALAVEREFQKKKVEVYFAFYVAKLFPELDQIGIQKLSEKGVRSFAVVTLTEMTEDGRVIAQVS